jgi:TP901 family phage tail tape measure protein
MKQLQADTGKMQLNVGNYPQLGGLVSTLGMATVGIGSFAAAGTAAIGVLKSNIDTAMQYEKAVSGLAAILGTTKDKMTDLTEQALHLGATTVFTASEVIQLQTELAKLGYSVQDILNMAPSVLDFAQATGSSLADAASLTGAALRMFEKDTTHAQEFTDKMTASTTKSALSFSFLQNAMSTVSPVANAFGFKIEEVLALLGQLANAGFDASSAATATRNILLNLADTNGKLAQALGQPVSNLDDLIAGLNTLKDRGIDLAEALELTDKRSVAAFNTFLSGADNVLNLRNELNAANGAARQMAETMGDNLDGALKGLSSAWEGLNLHVNEGNGLLRTLVGWLTELVRALDNIIVTISNSTAWDWYTDKLKTFTGWVINANGKVRMLWNTLKLFGGDGGSKDTGATVASVVDSVMGNSPATPASNNTGSDTATSPTSPTSPTKPKKASKGGKSAANNALKEQEQAQKRSLQLRREYEDALLETIDDEQTRERTKIIQQYDRKIEDLRLQLSKEKKLSVEDKQNIDNTIIALEQAKQVKLAELVEKGAKKQQQEQEKADRKAEQQRKTTLRESEKAIDLQYKLDLAEIDALAISENKKTQMRLQAEKERLQKLIALYKQNGKTLSKEEIAIMEQQIKSIEEKMKKNTPTNIYDMLGLNLSDEKKEAINTSFEYAMTALNDYMDAWSEAAQRKVDLATQEVDSAQAALDAERQARAEGYASNVAYAQKELDLAKKNQEKALREQQRAQQAQLLMDSVMQASNLITASTKIWAQLGFPWAIPALAVMWGSFAASKIMAFNATRQGTEQYGEGTVELLQGGSHQSGDDVDLGTKKDGTRRRAEGGEFFAVINKRNSRRFRKEIPDVIHALNDGTFADKYLNAYKTQDGMTVVEMGSNPDLRMLQDDVSAIREQGDRRTFSDGRGTHVLYKNVHRVIKN